MNLSDLYDIANYVTDYGMLFNKDCLDVLKCIDDETIDLVVTDCPYHIISGGCTNNAVKIGQYTEENNNELFDCTKQGKLFKHNDIEFKDWLPDIYRVLKQDTHCYIMINPRNLKELQQEAENVGFEFQNLIVWNKGNTLPNRYYLNSYELILMLRKGKAKNINNMGTKNILDVPNIKKNKLHPTEKPVDLMKILIENSSNENDIVLEPFMGVGATCLACEETKRRYIGIELDENYFNIAKNRLENL